MTYATAQPAAAILAPDVPRLDWTAFSARFFPERRRHDHEAIKAYGACRRELPVAADDSPGVAEQVWEGEGEG